MSLFFYCCRQCCPLVGRGSFLSESASPCDASCSRADQRRNDRVRTSGKGGPSWTDWHSSILVKRTRGRDGLAARPKLLLGSGTSELERATSTDEERADDQRTGGGRHIPVLSDVAKITFFDVVVGGCSLLVSLFLLQFWVPVAVVGWITVGNDELLSSGCR